MIGRAARMVRLGSSFVVAVIAASIVYWIWLEQDATRMPPGVVSGRGILAAQEVPLAAPVGGRVVEMLYHVNDLVPPGVPVLRIAAEDGTLRTVMSGKGGRLRGPARQVGDTVEPGAVLFALVDVGELHIVVPFDGRAARRVKVGGEARIVFADVGETPVTGRVVSVREPDGGMPAPVGGETRAVTATVDVTDAKSLALKPGLKADVYVRTEEGASWPVFIR